MAASMYDAILIEEELKKCKTNHLLHCLIFLVFFPWGIVWAMTAMTNARKRKKIIDRLKNG